MADTEGFMTKENFQYEKIIDKQEQVISKQDARINEDANTIKELQSQAENSKREVSESILLIEEKDEIILDMQETINAKSTAIRIYKTQVDEYTKVTEELNKVTEGLKIELKAKDATIAEKTKRIEELESASLSPTELLFYYACKADLVLYNYVQEGKLNLTYDELKAKKIPIEFLEQVKKKSFETTNYVLTFTDNTYRIKSTKK